MKGKEKQTKVENMPGVERKKWYTEDEVRLEKDGLDLNVFGRKMR